MARRSPEEAAQTRRHLMQTALQVFAEKGPDQATLKEISAQAGVTHGAMYWHFRNKEDLLAQLFQEYKLPMEAHYLEQRQAVEQDALAALNNYTFGVLKQLVTDPETAAIYQLFYYKHAIAGEDVELSEAINSESQHWRSHLEYFLKQARKQKQLKKKIDHDALCSIYIYTLRGVIEQWQLHGDNDKALAEAKQLLDALISQFTR